MRNGDDDDHRSPQNCEYTKIKIKLQIADTHTDTHTHKLRDFFFHFRISCRSFISNFFNWWNHQTTQWWWCWLLLLMWLNKSFYPRLQTLIPCSSRNHTNGCKIVKNNKMPVYPVDALVTAAWRQDIALLFWIYSTPFSELCPISRGCAIWGLIVIFPDEQKIVSDGLLSFILSASTTKIILDVHRVYRVHNRNLIA